MHYDIVNIGTGVGHTSLYIRAGKETDETLELLKKKKVLNIDAGPDNKYGAGTIGNWDIPANTHKDVVLRILKNHRLSLEQLNTAMTIQEGVNHPNLVTIGRLYKDIGEELRNFFENTHEYIFDQEIEKITLSTNNIWEVSINGEINTADRLIMSIGSEEKEHAELKDICRVKEGGFIKSSEVMNNTKVENILNAIKEGSKINIIGNSHSAFISIYKIIEEAKKNDIEIPDKLFTIFQRKGSNVKMFFSSIEEAIRNKWSIVSDNEYINATDKSIILTKKLHQCSKGMLNLFGGLRNPSREIAIKTIQNHHPKIQIEEYDYDKHKFSTLPIEGNITIQAIGFTSKAINLINHQQENIVNSRYLVNGNSEILDINGNPLRAHTIGNCGPIPINTTTIGENNKNNSNGIIGISFFAELQAQKIIKSIFP